MDTKDIRTLKILEEIDQDQPPSQRDLAIKLNISLGLVNSFIKRLVSKGYFKATTIPSNRVRYMMTPKGVAEKTRLTYEYIRFSFRFYKEARQKMKSLFAGFEAQGVQTVAFYGAGELAEIAYLSMQETGLALIAVFDEKRAGRRFVSLDVESIQALNSYHFDKIFITVQEDLHWVIGNLRDSGVTTEKIAFLQ